ncbi:DNA repair protein RecN [Comamonas serinivorans]|uniref:DNA repair protein RecN n=1 Tax=Comamonas serinivorans TaxID=1082851 RepID=A0A1Y0ERJ2_9BURK|nr:DNA repair protein RecN [Comamonas serinivorans]ARU06040.1 DNA repair protein RecN [Comamonas serinivorans]
MALLSLDLRDFVIVRELNLDFSNGFTVLTGETGAGKSILIDALQLALGARADAGVVREGTARAEISARFSIDAPQVQWLTESGFDVGGEEPAAAPQVLLRRTIDAQGKSRAWINGSAATATQLRELGDQLIDIHGQHAWQSLTRQAAVRELLDAFGAVQTAAVGQAWQTWRAAHERLARATAQQASLAQERERLMWQIGELERLNPQDGEWPQLNADHTRRSHVQALIEAAQAVCNTLDAEEGGRGRGAGGVLSEVGRCVDTLSTQAHIEPAFTPFIDLLSTGQAQFEEALHGLRAYLRHTDHDDDGLQALDERVQAWLGLAKRFRVAPEDLASTWQGWRQQLAELDAQSDLDALQQAEQRARTAYDREAQALSRLRHKAAPRLAAEVTDAMQALGMGGGRFEVALRAQAATSTGIDEVEFLVAGHAGVSPRPIGKVASGGELSRIALAIAVKTSALGQAQTLIFDEVDSGVGGAVAESVGRLMQQLGSDRQVLAVTHLPQVAAAADHHVLVSKQAVDAQTFSSLKTLVADERVQEIARMLGGSQITRATLDHARELLAPAAAASPPQVAARAGKRRSA